MDQGPKAKDCQSTHFDCLTKGTQDAFQGSNSRNQQRYTPQEAFTRAGIRSEVVLASLW